MKIQKNSLKGKVKIGACDTRVLMTDIKKESLNQDLDRLVGCRELSIH